MKKLSVVSGNMLYDIHTQQQYTTQIPEQIKDNNTKSIITDINKIINIANKSFIGKET